MRVWASRGFGPVRLGVSFGLKPLRAARRLTRSDRTGYVYIVRREGDDFRLKIGSSIDPPQRLRSLQTGSADRLYVAWSTPVRGDHEAVEHEAHAILDRHRGLGEWFSVPTDVAVAAISAASFRVGQHEGVERYPRRTRLIQNVVMCSLPVLALVALAMHVAAAETPQNIDADFGTWHTFANADPITDDRRALSLMQSPDRQWSLSVRCLSGVIGVLVRPSSDVASQAKIAHYEALIRADHGEVIRLPAQTYSQGGVIILDAKSAYKVIAGAKHLAFRFEGKDSPDQIDAEFDPVESQRALQPIAETCKI